MPTIAILVSEASSLIHFRGPLIKLLASRGIRVLALAPNYTPDTRIQVEAIGAEPVDFSLSRTGTDPFRDVRDMLSLVRLFRQLRPDVALSYAVKPILYGSLAAWWAGVPRRFGLFAGLGYVFMSETDSGSLKHRLLRRIVSRLLKFSIGKTDNIFFQNVDDLNELHRLGILPRDKGMLIGATGVKLDEWTIAPPVTRPVTFLLAARLLREKGILEFAKAARRVRASHPDTRFILLGKFDSNPSGLTPEEVQGWVGEGLLEWPGHVPVQPWLEQASVFVLPSYYREGVPRSIQEAMAMGRPVITTNAPGCRETVIDGQTGFLVPPRDVDALTERMLRFIDTPDLVAKMGLASRQLVEDRFDAEIINQKLVKELNL